MGQSAGAVFVTTFCPRADGDCGTVTGAERLAEEKTKIWLEIFVPFPPACLVWDAMVDPWSTCLFDGAKHRLSTEMSTGLVAE